jgi:hypothetical protein
VPPNYHRKEVKGKEISEYRLVEKTPHVRRRKQTYEDSGKTKGRTSVPKEKPVSCRELPQQEEQGQLNLNGW